MKANAIVTTILFGLASMQANADGFYQMVVGDAPQAVQVEAGSYHADGLSPLYEQVIRQSRVIAAGEVPSNTLAGRSDVTPLYLKVSGS